jgi:gamma-glutamylcyclotransferase (GGCT)/AIG2-like uncharacterized protein YtfP
MTIPEQFPIFVYGSLRPGELFYTRVRPYVEKVEPAELHGMQLYSLGDFPGMVWDASARNPVKGDLLHIYKGYWAEAISVLDRIEGEGFLYKRTQIIVICGETPVAAWTYLLRDLEKLIAQMDRIDSNDWKAERAQNATNRKSDSSTKPISTFSLFGATLKKATKLF